MSASDHRLIVDLRTNLVSGVKLESGVAKSVFVVEGRTEQSVEKLFHDTLLPLGDKIAAESLLVTIVIPNRFLLFKVFTIPAGQKSKVKELLDYEVQESFPHKDGELMWCSVPLVEDDVECQYLVAAFRSSVFESLDSSLVAHGIESVEMVPSAFLALAEGVETAKTDNATAVRHFCALEDGHLLHVAYNSVGGIARSKVLAEPNGSECLQLDDLRIPLERELKKSQTAIRRTLKTDQTASVLVVGNVGNMERVLHYVAGLVGCNEEAFRRVLPFQSEILSSRFRDVFAGENAVLKSDKPTLELTGADGWRLPLALVLLALTPYFWVWGNHRALVTYRTEISNSNRIMAEKNAAVMQLQQETEALESSLMHFEEQSNSELQQQALLALMQDLQDALMVVGDTWIETMDLALQTEKSTAAHLSLNGKFLVRQSNLNDEVRQQALKGAEKSLKSLEGALLASPFISGVHAFNVNYAGMDLGLNLVPFSIELELAGPFAAAENGERLGHE